MRELLQSKIHQARVTEANTAYTGSITIDQGLMDKIDLWEGQRVLVTSITSGTRLETYVIKGPIDSGQICMNGACAHLIREGEEITIMAFQFSNAPIEAKSILVDSNNRFLRYL